MRAVNLLPRQASNAKLSVDRSLVVAIAVTMLVVAALVGGFFLEKADAASKLKLETAAQTALAEAQNRQPTRHTPAPATLQIPVVLSQEEPWHVALDAALSTRVAWDTVLRDLEYVVPDRITLTSVSLGSSSAPTPGSGGGTITLGGSAYSATEVADFLSLLARVPHLTGVTLQSTSVSAGSNVVTFQIIAQMTMPVPAVSTTPTTVTTTTTGG